MKNGFYSQSYLMELKWASSLNVNVTYFPLPIVPNGIEIEFPWL